MDAQKLIAYLQKNLDEATEMRKKYPENNTLYWEGVIHTISAVIAKIFEMESGE